jgi:hypothetical protein
MRFPQTVFVPTLSVALVAAIPCLAAPSKKATPTVKVALPAKPPIKTVPDVAATPVPDVKAEPEAQYELQINNKPVALTLEKEMWVGMKAGPTRVKLVRSPLRLFDKSGVRFQYPVDYTFEADDSDPNVLIWTLSGTNSAIMVQQFGKVTAPTLINAVIGEAIKLYGRGNVKLSPVTFDLGSRKLQGKRLNVTLAKQKLMQEFYSFGTAKNSFIFMIQDSSGKGWQTQEVRHLKNLLYSSLQW